MQQIKGTYDDISYEITSQAVESETDLWTRVIAAFIDAHPCTFGHFDDDPEGVQRFYAAVLGALARHYTTFSPAEGTDRIADVIREMLDELVENGHL